MAGEQVDWALHDFAVHGHAGAGRAVEQTVSKVGGLGVLLVLGDGEPVELG